MKFPPGTEVAVHFDPRKPEDSALVPGIQPGLWKLVLLATIPAAILAGTFLDWGDMAGKNWRLPFGAAFALGGATVFLMGARMHARHRRSLGFPSVPGKLLMAGVFYESSGEGGGGYAPRVEFEYAVEGVTYHSSQLTAIPVKTLKSRAETAQQQVDRLRAMPGLTVYYDPRTPWDGFLQHGPAWGVYVATGMGGGFFAAGGWMAWYLWNMR